MSANSKNNSVVDTKKALLNVQYLNAFRLFNSEMQCLRALGRDLGPVADTSDEKIARDLQEQVQRFVSEVMQADSQRDVSTDAKTEETTVSSNRSAIQLTDEQARKINMIFRRHERSHVRHGDLLRSGTLMLAVAAVESLLLEINRIHCKAYPGFIADRCQVSLKSLERYTSVSDACDAAIERQIVSESYGPLRERLETMRKSMKIDLSALADHSDSIYETVYRRNLVAHNGSIVNHVYVEEVVPELREKYQARIGSKLPVDERYLRRAIDRMNLLGVVVIHQCWTKSVTPEDRKEADRALSDSIFNTLLDERYEAAENLGKYAVEINDTNDETARNIRLNYAQSMKWQGRSDDAKHCVAECDWSACGLKFKLGEAAIRDDFEFIKNNIVVAANGREIEREHLESWPIFKLVREQLWYPAEIAKLRADSVQQ